MLKDSAGLFYMTAELKGGQPRDGVSGRTAVLIKNGKLLYFDAVAGHFVVQTVERFIGRFAHRQTIFPFNIAHDI